LEREQVLEGKIYNVFYKRTHTSTSDFPGPRKKPQVIWRTVRFRVGTNLLIACNTDKLTIHYNPNTWLKNCQDTFDNIVAVQ